MLVTNVATKALLIATGMSAVMSVIVIPLTNNNAPERSRILFASRNVPPVSPVERRLEERPPEERRRAWSPSESIPTLSIPPS